MPRWTSESLLLQQQLLQRSVQVRSELLCANLVLTYGLNRAQYKAGASGVRDGLTPGNMQLHKGLYAE